MDNGAHSVQLKGVDHPVTLPGFSEREDIATVYTTEEGHPRRQSRILYAALGLCVSKLGGGLDAYEAADLDPVKYGGSTRAARQTVTNGRSSSRLRWSASSWSASPCSRGRPRSLRLRLLPRPKR